MGTDAKLTFDEAARFLGCTYEALRIAELLGHGPLQDDDEDYSLENLRKFGAVYKLVPWPIQVRFGENPAYVCSARQPGGYCAITDEQCDSAAKYSCPRKYSPCKDLTAEGKCELNDRVCEAPPCPKDGPVIYNNEDGEGK